MCSLLFPRVHQSSWKDRQEEERKEWEKEGRKEGKEGRRKGGRAGRINEYRKIKSW